MVATTSFYAPIPESPREDLLRAYHAFLHERDGELEQEGGFAKREAWLREADSWPVRHRREIDGATFERQFASFDPSRCDDEAALALLGLVKMNASEAYGVEVITRARHRRDLAAADAFGRVERMLAREETYHTRILVGAARQFGVTPPSTAFRPPLPLRLLINAIAYSPKAIYHPLVLGSEVAGAFMFSWMLGKVGMVFADEPELRETLERRLIEVLIDEVGHIAFNRMAVGPWGLGAARQLAMAVGMSVQRILPELVALGWNRHALHALARFDAPDLPEEVRRRAFYA